MTNLTAWKWPAAYLASCLVWLVVACGTVSAQTIGDDPIAAEISKSGIVVDLVPLVTIPKSGVASNDSHADINTIDFVSGSSPDLFVTDRRGAIWRVVGGQVESPAFLDLPQVRGSAFYLEGRLSTGLRSIAFHPDCAFPNRPGHCKLYTAHTETVASASAGVKIFRGGFADPVLFHNVIDEWDVDLALNSIDLSSRREVLRVEQRANQHNLDQLLFDPNALPGDSHYGLMWISLGDGISSPNNADPDNQARNPARLLGKIARINPLAQGTSDFTVPSTNPFFNTPGYLPEIWALGFRHPLNIVFDRGGSGQLIITDIGERQIEEVNLGVPGGDYGWPLRQGTFVNDRQNPDLLGVLPGGDAGLGFTYPVAQYDHDEGFAIVGGYVYRGSAIPELRGHYVFGDIVRGRVFHVPVADLALGQRAEIKELTLRFGGVEQTLLGALGKSRADLRFGIEPNGELLIASKQNGRIWRVRPTAVSPPSNADFELSANQLVTARFGNRFDGRTDDDGVITATFQNTGADALLSLDGFDVDFHNEVGVTLNGLNLGFLKTGPENDLNGGDSFPIAASMQTAGVNTLTFEQNLNDTYIWGITNILLSTHHTPPPAGSDFELVPETLVADEFGNKFNGQFDADGVITASFAHTGGDAELTLRGYDVDFVNEVRVTLNGNTLGFLTPGPNNDFNGSDTFTIPASQQMAGNSTLTFEQNLNDTYVWGITDILLSSTGNPPPPTGGDFGLVLGTLVEDEFGNKFNGQTDSDGVITAAFENTNGDAELTLTGYDVDFENEIRVSLNGSALGFLTPGPNNGLNSGDRFVIPANQQTAGTNLVTFEQNLNNTYVWGITDIRLTLDNAPPAGTDFVLVLNQLEEGRYGNRFAGQTNSDGVIIASFADTGGTAYLDVTGYDVDFSNEVRVTLNGNSLGFLTPGPNDGFNGGDSFVIPSSQQISGNNILRFEQNSNVTYIWGITDILLSDRN